MPPKRKKLRKSYKPCNPFRHINRLVKTTKTRVKDLRKQKAIIGRSQREYA